MLGNYITIPETQSKINNCSIPSQSLESLSLSMDSPSCQAEENNPLSNTEKHKGNEMQSEVVNAEKKDASITVKSVGV
jgi:hypothetical protein